MNSAPPSCINEVLKKKKVVNERSCCIPKNYVMVWNKQSSIGIPFRNFVLMKSTIHRCHIIHLENIICKQ